MNRLNFFIIAVLLALSNSALAEIRFSAIFSDKYGITAKFNCEFLGLGYARFPNIIKMFMG
ncbi:MAG: hypothetical protein AB2L24_20965 [Mangrovibacterium sp.]